jgi:hypothetical protein
VFLGRLGGRRNGHSSRVRAWFREWHIEQGVLGGKMEIHRRVDKANEKRVSRSSFYVFRSVVSL